MKPSAPPLDDPSLHAWADGRLSPQQAAALWSQWQADGAPAQEAATAWAQQRAQLRALAAAQPEPAPSARLEEAARKAQQAHTRWTHARRWWNQAAVAACVGLAFGLGWLARGEWPTGAATALTMAPSLRGAPAAAPYTLAAEPLRFAQHASMAHAIFQPEVRHPVEVSAAQQDHLVAWLSKRLGRPLAVPDLQPQGFELMGGRLLPGDSGPRAQFMYQNAAGVRVTLYVGALVAPSAAATTVFEFLEEGPVPAFYWVDHGFGYALSAPLPRSQLWTLVSALHPQL
ncbi:MAG: anti-sigma factor family protein [Burkholderiaceae bacterium]